MEEHGHGHEGHGGSCMSNCWSGHKFIWVRVLLGLLIVAFVFSAGVMIGRLGGRGHYRSGMYMHGGNYGYGYRMMGGYQPMMYQFQSGTPVTIPASVTK